MATNPLYSTNDSPNNQTQPTKAVNRQGVYVPRTHNTFDMSYFNFKTQKFGQYEPFFVMEGVSGDTIPFSNSHNVRALPMSSPFLSQLKLNKDYFMVPNQAIQPNTYEYIFKNPVQGDDVPSDALNIFPLFIDGNLNIIDNVWNNIAEASEGGDFKTVVFGLLWLELFLSQGSLLYQMGYKLNPQIQSVDDSGSYNLMSFDKFFDRMFSGCQLSISINSDSFIGKFANNEFDVMESGYTYVDTYTIISLIRRFGSSVNIDRFESSDSFEAYRILGLPIYSEKTAYINMDRLSAYQLACSQYYVNPQVDFLYNAQLYRDNMFSLFVECMSDSVDTNITTFDMNGIRIPYDYLSRNYYERYVYAISTISNGFNYNPAVYYDYAHALFGFRESLRFGDYFTDSRTRPLALGDDSVQVAVDNTVSVVDMSKSIIYQRFRNAVVKLGNNFGDYLRGIFGTSPSPDYHFPKFIVHQDFDVSGFEVSNTTADDQGNIVTNLNTQDDTYAFEVSCDMPCIILGISYFSLPRVYCQTKDRQFFHQDRYDFFNPMLQYVGDQIVYNEERTDLRPNNEIFGYQSRYNEYKQRYGVASGGFVELLPSYTFVTDSLFGPVTDIAVSNTQSPNYIRASDYEFNRFMARIPGVSMCSGFHFIVVYNNKCVCSRPMEINPSTL